MCTTSPQTSNHSIERISDRLRRPATAHVKRYVVSMNRLEKTILMVTGALAVVYIVAFNLNVSYYWGSGQRVFAKGVVDALWGFLLLMSVATLAICIRDTGLRQLQNRGGWIFYILLLGAVAIPHYYIKHGRWPRG